MSDVDRLESELAVARAAEKHAEAKKDGDPKKVARSGESLRQLREAHRTTFPAGGAVSPDTLKTKASR